jgi:hypothetical protein
MIQKTEAACTTCVIPLPYCLSKTKRIENDFSPLKFSGIASLFLFFIFFPILWCSHTGDHPHEEYSQFWLEEESRN